MQRRIFVSIQRAAIKQRVGSVGFYERCKLACERELMGSPANFNLWGECVAQYVALYKSCARNRASISVSKRRVGHRLSGRKCAFLISSFSNPLNFQLSLPLRRVNILFIFRHAMPINVVCCARCHLAFPFPCVLSRKPTLVSRFVFRLDVFRSVRTFLYDLLTSVLPEVKPVLP